MLGVLAHEPLAWALAAFYFLDLWWIRCLLDLPANAAARSIWAATRGCRFSNRRIRRARHSLPPARWLAIRPDWWVASSFMDSAGCGCLRIVAGCAIDAAVHGWSARMRCLARHRQRRSISTCASIFPNPKSHGHRTGGRDGRDGGIFPAFASRHVPRPARSGLAGISLTVRGGLSSLVDEWSGLLAAGRSCLLPSFLRL